MKMLQWPEAGLVLHALHDAGGEVMVRSAEWRVCGLRSFLLRQPRWLNQKRTEARRSLAEVRLGRTDPAHIAL
ncbi:hypothetical protein D3C81_1367210 [compost metagenome]